MLQSDLSTDEKLVFQHQYNDEKKSPLIGLLLALSPLGYLGIHWFWLGEREKGRNYIGFFIGGVLLSFVVIGFFIIAGLAIACIIDALNMGDTTKNFNRKLGRSTFDAVVGMRKNSSPVASAKATISTEPPPLPEILQS